MKQMTEREYRRLPAEYRGERNGHPYALYLDPEYGTCWGPVEIIPDPKPARTTTERTDR